MKKSVGRVLFQIFNYGFLIALSFITLYPFWYVLVGSIVPYTYYSAHPHIALAG